MYCTIQCTTFHDVLFITVKVSIAKKALPAKFGRFGLVNESSKASKAVDLSTDNKSCLSFHSTSVFGFRHRLSKGFP